MTHERAVLEIGANPELRRLVETVRETGQPGVLRLAGEDVAVVLPTSTGVGRSRHRRTSADHEAFLSSAGSWQGLVDADVFNADNAEQRRRSSRSPVRL